jgi:sulfur-carrier protein
MSVQVQVFAVLKDYFKTEFELESPIVTIEELKGEMEKMNPSSKKILQACRFAVNDQFVTQDYKLNEHDKVVVLPPSSGG